MFARSLVALALAATSFAVITPTSPDSATVVKVGENINALWSTDTTGQWTNVQIELMTGDNQAMVPLLTLATGIDGTKEDSFSYPAPEVEPYSKIYFLQFTLGGDVSTATWTTRFTIAGPNGETTEPTNTTTFDGQTVGWGTGMVINAANATAGGASSNSTSSTSPLSMSASASPSAAASASESAMQLAAPSSATASASRSISQSASASRAAAASASTTGAAAHSAKVQFSLGALALGLAGFAWL